MGGPFVAELRMRTGDGSLQPVMRIQLAAADLEEAKRAASDWYSITRPDLARTLWLSVRRDGESLWLERRDRA